MKSLASNCVTRLPDPAATLSSFTVSVKMAPSSLGIGSITFKEKRVCAHCTSWHLSGHSYLTLVGRVGGGYPISAQGVYR